MNINLAYPFSLLALFVSSAMADQVADSRISDVTVYPDSANITRTIEVVLPAGSETILIPGLPASIDENSLRIKGTTGKKTQVVSLDLKKETRADWVLPQVSELQKKLEQQQDALAILMANDQALTIQQQYLQKIAEQGGGEKANAGSADWQKNMQVLGDGMKNTGAARVALSREIKIRKNEIAATKRALDAINNQQKDTRTALIHLQSDGGKAQLMLSYQLSDARWSPVYDANLDTKSSKLQVTQAAYIQQNTGENWDQVALTLSTLRPNSSSVPPRLYSWWIDYHDIRPVARNTLLKSAERMADAAPEMMAMAPVEEQQAVVLNTGYQVAYQIPGRVSVSSSQEKQRVVIDQQQWPAEMTLKAVPKQDPHAYRITSYNVCYTKLLRMLAKKYIGHWLIWIFVDALSAGLYVYKGLWPTVILFVIYTAMAVLGYIEWKKDLQTHEE